MALLMRILCLFFALLFAMGASGLRAEGLQLQEQEIKAGLLYNFLKYIEWPAPGDGPAAICIFGADPFSGYLQSMSGRTVNQREITVRNVHDPQDAAACSLLFVNADEKDRWPMVRQSLSGKSILTVSDYKGFASAGGMIEFGIQNDHIHAWLNMDAVKAARLRVQDRLLKLVTVVHALSQAER